MTPPNASPQPILTGVPVAMPCFVWSTQTKRWYWWTKLSVPDQSWLHSSWTHYLVAPELSDRESLPSPATADPATFPKADPRNDWAKPERLLREAVECAQAIQRNIDVDLGGIPPGDIWLTTIHAHAHVIETNLQMLTPPPSTRTEQKERGERKAFEDYMRSAGCDKFPHDAWQIWCAARRVSLPATTDGTTTPRTEQFWKTLPFENRTETVMGLRKFAERLERELQEMTEHKDDWLGKHADISARLSLTEKRLGEAQQREADLHARLDTLQERDVSTSEVIQEMAVADDLRAQLATSQARLVEVEREGEKLREVATRLMPFQSVIEVAEVLAEKDTANVKLSSALAQAKQDKSDAVERYETAQHFKDETDKICASLRAANTALQEQVKTLQQAHDAQYMLGCKQAEELATLSAQVEELKRDGERLTWLAAASVSERVNAVTRTSPTEEGGPNSLRCVIDAALRPQTDNEGSR